MILTRLQIEIAVSVLLTTIFVTLWVHHDHVEQNIGQHSCEAKLTETKAQMESAAAVVAAKYQETISAAQKQHEDDIRRLPVISTPIILHDHTICAGPAPSLPATESVPPNVGGTKPGLGDRDIRPTVEAFKLRYETALADCRLALSEWPK